MEPGLVAQGSRSPTPCLCEEDFDELVGVVFDRLKDMGLAKKGWIRWTEKSGVGGSWIRPQGDHGPYAVKGSEAWFADLNEIEARRTDIEEAHSHQVEDALVFVITAMKEYRAALNAAEADGFHVAIDLKANLDG